ncbi:MAG TPA: IS66 family transposase [Burkholderiales bacterium]|nr:IS66 family transposase [Burkholderiales bacterium]
MDTDVPLAIDPASLPRDPEVLVELIAQLLVELRKRDGRIEDLEHRMHLLLRRLYGGTSEKLDPAQLALFDTTPEEPVPELPPISSSTRPTPHAGAAKKPGHGRRRLPDRLKRVKVVHDLTPAEKELLGGEANLVLIGQEETEQLEWEPSSLYVIQHVQLTYARRDPLPTNETLDDEHSIGQRRTKNVITAAKPPQPIPGGLPGPGLMAHVATSKYVDHVPLNRQERQFTRHGVFLARQTTCDWALAGAALLAALYELLKREVLRSDVVHVDATSVKIRHAQKRLKHTGYFWTYAGDDQHALVAFECTPTHSRDGPAAFLRDFRGYLQADAHSVYDGLYIDGRIVEVGCWMHARRGFFEARALDRLRTETALAYIGRLYAGDRKLAEQIAGEWRELPRDDRHARIAAVRQEQSQPVLEEFFPWLEAEAPKLLPKNPVRQAMDYALRQRVALLRYCEDGRLAIDNGVAERALRGIALGRRNWLFCGSERGARAACVYFSLAASCLRHEIDPFAYLRDLFTRMPVLLADRDGRPSDEELRPLLPDRWLP